MSEVSARFLDNVRAKWGNPRSVAEAGVNETFEHPDRGFDHDDQVNDAILIGVLAGEMKDMTPEAFVERFENEILNDG